jgi:RNA polymerase sigma-70 factor (ECF subfamily)
VIESIELSVPRHEITQLLNRWANGDKSALDRLMPLVYLELHELAKRYMSDQDYYHTLQTTALVHEAYIKLVGNPPEHWENRGHFYAVAAKAMRQVLVDHARALHASKRGGGVDVIRLADDAAVAVQSATELIALDDALTGLARLHPRQCEAVELHYFGGLSVDESANVLKVSRDTVIRDLRFAKAWLRRELGAE